jgi:ATP-dependent Clp protease ATP-binding subunit ClpA
MSVSFSTAVIIMTSNLGMQELTTEAAKIGFAERDAGTTKTPKIEELEAEYSRIKDGVLEQVRRSFKPEFINRIDKIIVFKPLGPAELRKIVGLQLTELAARLKNQRIQLKTTAALAKFVAEQSFDPLQGARFIRKNVETLIEDPLAEKIILSRIIPGSTIHADAQEEKVHFKIEKAKTRTAVPA